MLEFITEQRAPRRGNVVRLDDGEAGPSARMIARRLLTRAGLFGYLTARGVVTSSPVPSGPVTWRPASRGRAAAGSAHFMPRTPPKRRPRLRPPRRC